MRMRQDWAMISALGLRRKIPIQSLNFPLCLAPMVGLSHVALRAVLRAYLPTGARTIWPTEMLNSRRLPHENLAKTPETMRTADETQLVPQILGNDEGEIAASLKCLESWGAEGIDINMGCPVKKALSHNYGVALMGDPEYEAEVVRICRRHTRLPISVKLRSGLENNPRFLADFVGGLEGAGASWITLHPRTAGQQRRGRADWSQIRELREGLGIPVIGNGDIQTVQDVVRMLEETGCEMAMAGRALAARPWLLWQFGEKLGWPAPQGRSGPAPDSPEAEGAEYGRAALAMLQHMRVHFTDEFYLRRKYLFYVRTTSPWLRFGHDFYARSTRAKSTGELEAVASEFFSRPQEMSARTELRQ